MKETAVFFAVLPIRITLLRIRIQLSTLMRIRIQLPKMMRIRIRNTVFFNTGNSFLKVFDTVV